MNIIKRDKTIESFDFTKIINAIIKAFKEVDGEITPYAKTKATNIANYIYEKAKSADHVFSVEEIQDLVEKGLMTTSRKDVAKAYILYRERRTAAREYPIDRVIEEIISGDSEYWNSENSNKNAKTVTTQRDYIAGACSTDITRRRLLPEIIVKAHDEGILHFHDADYFLQKSLHNCELINLNDMLQNGTVVNGTLIERPHEFSTACTIATQIILGVSSASYGGASISISHLAPFVRSSYEKYYNKYLQWGLDEEKAQIFATRERNRDIEKGVQTFNYQVNSMTNTNGQAPFLSVFMYLNESEEYKVETALIIEEFLKQRILGFKNEQGIYISPAFPKLLYVLEEDNISEDGQFWYLTKLAAKCTAKRMVPDYISEKIMKNLKINKWGDSEGYPCMGCRSFLTPWTSEGNPSKAKDYVEGKGKYYGRFNQGVVTINLADIGLSAVKASEDNGTNKYDEFWRIFDERLELCHQALQIRHKRLEIVTSDAAPLLWQHGALARLAPGESIAPLLHDNYSTLSLGYAALYECVKAMTGFSHTGEGKEFGLEVMRALNDKCNEWKEAENIGYSLYGTPIESTTYKFAKCLKKRFGIIEGITDRDYVTNSYHVPVFEKIDAFTKLALESEFQELSPGGAISYIEVPNMTNNIPAILDVIKFIYDHIMYAEINTKSDYCQVCGFDGEIQIKGETGNLYWECPNCGNHDQSKLNVARRTCGYIGTQFWNQGRTQEIRDRVLHIGGN